MSDVLARLVDELAREVADRAEAILRARLDARPASVPTYLNVAEAAELLRAKPQRVYDLLSDGRLTRHKDGSRVLIERAELVAHLSPNGSQGRLESGVRR